MYVCVYVCLRDNNQPSQESPHLHRAASALLLKQPLSTNTTADVTEKVNPVHRLEGVEGRSQAVLQVAAAGSKRVKIHLVGLGFPGSPSLPEFY